MNPAVLDADDPRARAALASAADLFTSPPWLSVLAESYSFPIHVVFDSGTGAALPVALVDDFAGRRLICMPFSDYVGPAIEPGELRRLLDAAAERFPDFRQSVKTLDDDIETWIERGWALDSEAVLHRLEVHDEDHHWKGLAAKFRNQVRQGQRNGVTASANASLEALKRFYDLHAKLRNAKFSAIPQPWKFFEAIYRHFFAKGDGFVLEAEIDGEIASACVVLAHGDTLYYKFSASRGELLKLRPNNVMLWELLREAVARGSRRIDLGISGLGESYRGLRHFKRDVGGEPRPVFTLRRTPLGASDSSYADFGEFRGFVGDLSRLIAQSEPSLETNDRAASLLYRYFA